MTATVKLTADDRRNQILTSATRLFSQEGFDKITTKELASSCGITEPALYRYYPSKDALYDAVLDHLQPQLECREVLDSLVSENDVEKLLTALTDHVLAFFQHHEESYRLLLFSALSGHAKAKKVYQAVRGTYVEFLSRQLDRLMNANIVTLQNSMITSRCFIGMLFDCALGSTLWKGFQGKRFKPSEVVANNVPIFVRGLRRSGPGSGDGLGA